MKRFILVVVIVVVSVSLLAVKFLINFNDATNDVTDPSAYPAIRTQLRTQMMDGTKGLSFFPISIPNLAKDVRLFYRPHFLQGGPVLQISYRIPDSSLNSIVLSPPASTTQPIDKNDNIPGSPDFWVADPGNSNPAPLPSDYQAFVIDAKWPLSPTDVDEGYSYGIAISMQRHRIIYWAQN
jgi:hypothetical protein